MKKKIAIVGYGYVGKAMFNFFKDHYLMHIYDPYNKTSPCEPSQKEDVNECDLAVVCVPTPRGENGECDISIVEEVISWIDVPILLKSTVEVGTTEKLIKKYKKSIVFSPEYCGESSYWSPYKFHTDIKETPFFIFGGYQLETSMMVDFFLPVTGPTKKYIQTDSTTAEFVKYMENTFYATKIVYCYEMFEIARQCNIDWNEARELWLLDPRINPMHTCVFEENDWPFSGKCLPKDTAALVSLAQKTGYEPELLKEVLDSNERLKQTRLERRNDFGISETSGRSLPPKS